MQNTFFLLLISSLAVFRLAEAVAVDNGPFHIFLAMRKACKSHPVLCEFITCFYCLSGWLTIIVVAGLHWADLIQTDHVVLWWAGIWGGAAFILRAVRERE